MTGQEIPNLIELARASVARFGSRPLFGEKRDGQWQWMTYGEWHAHVDALRGGLAALGVRAGDRVAIVSRNSSAWATSAYASYGLGATFVPMYEPQRPQDWEFILRDCEAKVVFCRTPQILAAIEAMKPRLPALQHIILMEGPASDPRTLAALAQRGRAAPVEPHQSMPEDVAGLIYTSGTTGFPKGVMLTHHNLTSNVIATVSVFPISDVDRSVSFLPWAHVYGQVVELHMLLHAGASTAFNTDPQHLLEDLKEVKPTMLIAVPRIFNRIHAGVRAQIAEKPRAVRYVFDHGLAASIRHRRGERLSAADEMWRVLAGVMFGAIRRKFGGRLKYAVSAAATLSRDVAEFIDALGLDVYEGYGLTEASPVVATNRPGKRKIGSVGQPIPGVRVVLDETASLSPGEGEIIVYGPNVMKGYHARPEENARAFTSDSGLRTGDLGRFDGDGYLYITGRIKEQYKLENGKYVMPAPLEEKLALSPYIQSVVLSGAGKPFTVALVVIDSSQIRKWAEEQHIELGAEITKDPRVRALIQGELDRNSVDFRSYERPLTCTLTEQPFTLENGLLTPTLKVRRRDVAAIYGSALDALYSEPLPPHVPPGVAATRELAAH